MGNMFRDIDMKAFAKIMSSPEFKYAMAMSIDVNVYTEIDQVDKEICLLDEKLYRSFTKIIQFPNIYHNKKNSSNSYSAIADMINMFVGISNGDFNFTDNESTLIAEIRSMMSQRQRLEHEKFRLLQNAVESYKKQMNSKEVRDIYVSLFGKGKNKSGLELLDLWK